MNPIHTASTRATCVCWSMTSDTSTPQGSEFSRKARQRPFRPYQARSAPSIASRSAAESSALPTGGILRAELMPQTPASPLLRPLRIALVAPPLERVPPAAYGGTERVIDELARELCSAGMMSRSSRLGRLHLAGAALVPTVRTPLRARGDERDPSAAFLVTLARSAPPRSPSSTCSMRTSTCGTCRSPGGPHRPRRSDVPLLASTQPGLAMRLARSRARPVAISAAQARQPDPPIGDWVHNGLSLERMPFGATVADDLVFVGRMTADKGVADAIEVARRSGRRLRIIAKIPYLAIERDYYDGVVKPALRRADVEELGELGQDDRDRVVAESHALVMPSVWPEPFGLTAIEAMATGTPVIARAVGALPEIVRQGRDGFLAPDAAGMAAALDGVAALDRAAIRRDAIERFSAARMADGYERIYSRILERHAFADSIAVKETHPRSVPRRRIRRPASRLVRPPRLWKRYRLRKARATVVRHHLT